MSAWFGLVVGEIYMLQLWQFHWTILTNTWNKFDKFMQLATLAGFEEDGDDDEDGDGENGNDMGMY